MLQSRNNGFGALALWSKRLGMKSPDNMAIFACAECHAHIDGANRWDVSAKDYLRALAETQAIWIEQGLILIN